MQYKNKNTRTQPKLFRINVMLIVLVIGSAIVTLALANHGANQRYAFAQSLEDLSALQSSQRKLLNKAAELQSTSRLAVESQRLNLVRTDVIQYVTVPGAVALNR